MARTDGASERRSDNKPAQKLKRPLNVKQPFSGSQIFVIFAIFCVKMFRSPDERGSHRRTQRSRNPRVNRSFRDANENSSQRPNPGALLAAIADL